MWSRRKRKGNKRLTSLPAYLAAAALLLGFIVVAGATAAKPALRDVTRITEGLIDTAIAYEIGDKCDTLDARLVAGVNFLYGLRAYAVELGYTDPEIDAYVEDRAEQQRLESIARSRLRDKGAVDGQWDTYCAVGRQEIAANSQIGRLLR